MNLSRTVWGLTSLTDGFIWAINENGERVRLAPVLPYHTLIAGISRTGKTKGSQAILIQTAKCWDVQVVGIDPAFSLLRPWATSTNRPQDFVLGTSPDALEKALALVNALVSKMEERLMSLGRSEKIDEFDIRTPVLLVVLEEYAGLQEALASWDKKKAAVFTAAVGRLLREGAKVGIRVFTIIQRAEAATLKDRSQYGRRISYAQDNTDSVKMLFDQAEPETVARIISLKPGRGVLKEIGNPNLTWFQTPDMSYEDYYSRIEAHAFTEHEPVMSGE